ncbi:hypothetical protein [Actinoplanes sp. G11-F43]|uniref:hypothetical protein n=1 Tax=Actinoplanes sp. G11-F43 TaxID=3424130 RepID=UPI003D354671
MEAVLLIVALFLAARAAGSVLLIVAERSPYAIGALPQRGGDACRQPDISSF